MAVRDSIFGSKSEEKGFRAIEHMWGEDYVVYPQIPMSALFAPDPDWGILATFSSRLAWIVCCVQKAVTLYSPLILTGWVEDSTETGIRSSPYDAGPIPQTKI